MSEIDSFNTGPLIECRLAISDSGNILPQIRYRPTDSVTVQGARQTGVRVLSSSQEHPDDRSTRRARRNLTPLAAADTPLQFDWSGPGREVVADAGSPWKDVADGFWYAWNQVVDRRGRYERRT
jgi:hypothetical protein